MNNNINEIHVQNAIFNINDKNKKISIDKKTNKKLFLNINKEVKAKSSKIKSKKLLNKKEEKNNYKDNIKQFHNNKGKSKELFINKLETLNDQEKNNHKEDTYRTNYELQDMDYEEAIIYDKRNCLKIYWSFLLEKQIILGTFCTENYLNLLIIKLSFFIFTFQISFFLNALFYTDEYISDAYHNDGILDFFSGLPKSIYSFIATLVTTNLLGILSNSETELIKLVREKRNDKNYCQLMNNTLKKLRNKLIAYFIIIFLLSLLFSYYVVSFCAVYRHSQKYWFLGCLESFGIDSLVALISCIFLTIFRFISVKKHIKCLFIIGNIIGKFL